MNMPEALKMLHIAEKTLQTAPYPRTDAWYQIWLEIKFSQADSLYFQQRYEEMTLLCDALKEPVQKFGSIYQQSTYFSLLVMLNNIKLHFNPEPESAEYARQALELIEPVASKNLVAQKGFMLGFQLLWVGKLEDAVETLRRSWRLAEEIGALSIQNRSVTYLLVAYRMLGNEAGVRNHIEEAIASTKEEQITTYMGAAQANLAWLDYRSGDLEKARSVAMEALDYWGDHIYPFRWLALLILVDLELQDGKLETAVGHAFALLEPTQGRLPDPMHDLLQSAVALWPLEGKQQAVENLLNQVVALAHEYHYL
jgi:tetratricopeptide (TPR) repeat protein